LEHAILLRPWSDAPAFVLSCPGPLRRHHAALLPISQLTLPQCLLGGEAQLAAFAASAPAIAARAYFAPLPEIFGNPQSVARVRQMCGVAPNAARLVHLRFGGTRSARIMKEARNGLVLAENHAVPAISASNHPFADGLTVPALMRRVFACATLTARPASFGGKSLPVSELPSTMVGADLAYLDTIPDGGPESAAGLEIVSLAEFRSHAFSVGPVRAISPDLRAAIAAAARDRAPFVLLPWNLDHPGSVVPALVERTLHLQNPGQPAVRLLIMPFNYPGQTGLIRRLIRRLREELPNGSDHLPRVFLGRLARLDALPALRRLARVAWVDGNDPEHDWTARRLAACGFSPLLLAADDAPASPGIVCIAADEALTVNAETRFGLLSFRTHLPSLRALRQLLPLTRSLAVPAAARDVPPRLRTRPSRHGA